MTEDAAFRTQDMALAAVLVVQGHPYRLEQLSRSRAQWVFLLNGQKSFDIDEIIDEYEEFALRVEPRSFLEEVGRLRKELYLLCPPAWARRAASSASG